MNGRGQSRFRGKERSGGDSQRSASRGRGRGGRGQSPGRGGDRGRGRGGSRGSFRGDRGDRSFSRGGIGKRRPFNDGNAPGGHGHSKEQDGQQTPFRPKKKFNPEGNNKQNLTNLSESIFNKGVAGQDKEKFIERSLLILDEYGIDNVIVKNSGSRLVQACLKYGNNTSKEVIFLKIMKSNVDKIFTDNFGKYLAKKIMVHIKDKKLLHIFHNYIEANFSKLLADANGRIALSDYFESLPEFRSLELLKERLGRKCTEEEAREKVEAIMTAKSFNNSLDQFWLYSHWTSLPEDLQKPLLEELKENLESLLETKINGILLYCKVFDTAELKDKTKMLKKCIAKKLDELVKKNQNVLFLFAKITHSYDDSGNIATILYNEILANLNAFVENQVTVTYLFYILCEDFDKEFGAKFHPKLVETIKGEILINSGKKPIDRKLEEARQRLFTVESFRELIKPEFISKCYDSTFICVLISMILGYFVKSETCKEAIQEFVTVVLQNTKDCLDGSDSVDLNKSLLLSHPFTHRMVKKFIQAIGTAPAEFKTELEGMIEELARLMVDNLSTLLRTRTVFIYIALMENTSYKAWIVKRIKSLPEFDELKSSSDAGLKILFKILDKD